MGNTDFQSVWFFHKKFASPLAFTDNTNITSGMTNKGATMHKQWEHTYLEAERKWCNEEEVGTTMKKNNTHEEEELATEEEEARNAKK